jgi:hypothetical protein
MHLKFPFLHWFLIVGAQFRKMKYGPIIVCLFLVSCGGTLSDEQRKKIKEEMALSKIVRVTDAELTEAAFAKGRSIFSGLSTSQNNPLKADSVANASDGKIKIITDEASISNDLEKQVFEAYVGSESVTPQDNVQKIRLPDGTESDSLLYTKPIFGTDNTSKKFIGMWRIWLSRKQLILEMSKRK